MNNTTIPTATAKPFVKWAGGKRSLLTELHKHLPKEINNYFEPFLGGGALFFSLEGNFKNAYLSDLNEELFNTYFVIRCSPNILIKLLEEHAKKHCKDYYYEVRAKEFHETQRAERAARFIYLNRTCFNGLYRVNKKGKFNVPMGSYKNPKICDSQNILACHEYLKHVSIGSHGFLEINDDMSLMGDSGPEKEDFVYFDPPYYPLNRTSFTTYTADCFLENEHTQLRDFAVELDKKGVHVMISNSKTQFVEDLFEKTNFSLHVVTAPRNINSKASKRKKVEELIIKNY